MIWRLWSSWCVAVFEWRCETRREQLDSFTGWPVLHRIRRHVESMLSRNDGRLTFRTDLLLNTHICLHARHFQCDVFLRYSNAAAPRHFDVCFTPNSFHHFNIVHCVDATHLHIARNLPVRVFVHYINNLISSAPLPASKPQAANSHPVHPWAIDSPKAHHPPSSPSVASPWYPRP